MTRSLAFLVAILAAAISPAAAQEKISITPELIAAANGEGEMTLQYSAPLNAMQALVAEFGKVYPTIKINLERKAGSSGVQSLLQEISAGVNRLDMFQGTDTSANAELVKQKAFAAITFPNIDEFSPVALGLAPYLYYPDSYQNVVLYNPKFVTDAEAEKLRSWDGILDPAFKGKISLVEPTFGVTIGPLLYVMNQPKLGEDFLRKLKAQNPIIFINTAQARDAVLSGRAPISWGAQWDSVVFSDYERGAPVRFLFPHPTAEWGGNGWAILGKAPHPNAARLFFAWAMTKDGAMAIQGPQYNARSTMKTMEDTRTVLPKLKNEPWFTPVGTDLWRADVKDWVENAPRYQELWTKIMKAGR